MKDHQMRHIIAVAAIGVALFAASACADQPQEEPNPTPTTAAPTAGAVLDDKKTSCDSYSKLDTEFETKISSIALTLQTSQNDPVKAASALTEGLALLRDHETKLSSLEAKAGDAEVKAALKDEVNAVKKLQTDINAAGSDPVKIQAAIEGYDQTPGLRLESLCGIGK